MIRHDAPRGAGRDEIANRIISTGVAETKKKRPGREKQRNKMLHRSRRANLQRGMVGAAWRYRQERKP